MRDEKREAVGTYDKRLLASLGVDVSQIEHLTAQELMVLEQCLSELTESDEGISATAVSLLAEDYKWEPVSMEQFLHDPYYMGSYSHEIFPGLKAAMIEIFDGKKLPSEVLLTGGIGYGKCLKADTLCPTSNGLKTIKSMAIAASKGRGDEVLTHRGNITRAAAGTHPGVSATKKIVTHWGYEIEGRPEHRIKIYRGEKLVWRRLDEVQAGDLAVIQAGTDLYGDGGTLTAEQAEALGACSADPTDSDADVPDSVLLAPKEVQCAFLIGVFGAVGSVSSGHIVCSTASEKLAYKIQAMLLNAGVLADRHTAQAENKRNGVPALTETWVIRIAAKLDGSTCHSGEKNLHRLFTDTLSGEFDAQSPPVVVDAHRKLATLPIKSITDSEADCWDISVPGDESYVANGFLSHNTTISSVMLAYNAYRVTCLHDPHTYYKLAKGSAIYFGIYSLSLDQAMDGMYGKVIHHIDRIPYFDQRCPRVKRTNSEVKFSTSPLRIIFGSKSEHIIGRDLLNFACDEINFFEGGNEQKPGELTPVEKLYTSALRRIQTRFPDGKGGSLGMTILASSRASKVSFLDRHIKESAEPIRKGDTKLISFATWEVRPASQYKLPRFAVEVGDRMYPPRVLREGEEPRPGAEVVHVPGEFKEIFERDAAAGLRDIAGVSTESMMPLIHDKSSISDCACAEHQHPFTRDELVIDLRDDTRIDQYFVPERMFYVNRSAYTMRLNPQSPRYVSIDIGYVSDALGLSMSHIAGFRVGKVLRRDGTWFEDRVPIVVNDFSLRIVPPQGSETNISCVRSFLLSLRDYGVPIALVTADSHQSRSELQILRKMGFTTAPLSVDQTDEPYLSFRQAIMERRWVMYPYPTLMRELRELERDIDKRKVDHPAISPETGLPGGKDVADAAASSYYAALTDKRGHIQDILNTLPLIGDTLTEDLFGDRTKPVTRPIRHVPVDGGQMLWRDLEKDVQ